MTARFADTNVLLYAVSGDPGEEQKARIARELLTDRELVLSVQVLQEFFVQATRSTRAHRMEAAQASALLESFTRFRVVETTLPLVTAAVSAQARFGISYWDAAIVEAARASGCRELLSEDLADGQDYGGVRVVNPFRIG